MPLYNTLSREDLQKRLNQENFKRKTISFYRYIRIENPKEFRDVLYQEWDKLQCLGRIYIAREGINAQMSIPEHKLDTFLEKLNQHEFLNEIPIKHAIEDDGKSFFKLNIKVRPKIVADGLDEGTFDVANVGKHLSALEFHELLDSSDTMVVDMRNHYESEIGHFKNAICPNANTFREELEMIDGLLTDKKDKKVLLYCTGGIRCEKASAYLKQLGYNDVNQLHGGILEYARQINKFGMESKFNGKNFVFDSRLGEIVDGEIISHCHQCDTLANTHTNCANADCHLLFIQCSDCTNPYEGCCCHECKEVIHMSAEEQRAIRQSRHKEYSESKIFKSRLRPNLMQKAREEKIYGQKRL